MARAVAAGHDVHVVFATDGALGDTPEDLAPGERVGDRRRVEGERSCGLIGTTQVHWLGFHDSGMTGWPQNSADGAFAAAPVLDAATALAQILDTHDADVVIGYDWHGNYGHPDHVQVHRVVRVARELARRRPRLLERSPNRDMIRELFKLQASAGLSEEINADGPMDDGNPMGSPESELRWQVDVSPYADLRRECLRAHASQTSDAGAILALPDPMFRKWFAWEHYREDDLEQSMTVGWPFGPDSEDPRANPGAHPGQVTRRSLPVRHIVAQCAFS